MKCPKCKEEMMSLNHRCNPLRNAFKDWIPPVEQDQIIFTEEEIKVLKEIAQDHIHHNLCFTGEKTNPKPNIFPKDYVGPRSYAEAISNKWEWDSHKQKWIEKRK